MARVSSKEQMWNKLSRTVFQDRAMPYAYWVQAVTNTSHSEHQKILEQSIMMLNGGDFVRLLGEQTFFAIWKQLRHDCTSQRNSVKQGIVILDGIWASIATGFAFVNPDIKLAKPLSNGLKKTFTTICRYASRNVYQIAKDINRPYNRVYEDVKKLEAIGLVKSNSQFHDGRRVKMVFAA